METPKEIVDAILSKVPPPSQENTPTLNEEGQKPKNPPHVDRFLEERRAISLGGLRALKTYTPDKFIPSEITRVAFDFCSSFDASRNNIYLSGPTGSGKSHLAAIAARKYIEDPRNVKTFTPMQLYRELRAQDGAVNEFKFLDAVTSCPVLVLDDLGSGKDSEFSVSTTLEVIHRRYMDTPGGLIITSNLGLDTLATKLGDDRVSSRLAQICKVFNLTGANDYRIK